MRTAAPAAEHGFTLVELVITMLLVSVAALGVSYVLSFGLQRQSDPLWQSKAVALAAAYHEEILARRFDENTPVGGVPPCSPSAVPCSAASAFDDGESRAEYDDVDDFDGVSDAPPRDVEGNVREGYASYRVDVDVGYPDAALVTRLGLDDPTDAKLVTVTVTSPEGGSLAFSALKASF